MKSHTVTRIGEASTGPARLVTPFKTCSAISIRPLAHSDRALRRDSRLHSSAVDDTSAEPAPVEAVVSEAIKQVSSAKLGGAALIKVSLSLSHFPLLF